MARLLDDIEAGPSWRLHGLLRALYEDGQDEVITQLGVNINTYQVNLF